VDTMKILIIDDQSAILESLSMHFQEMGYDVCTAEYGENGIEKVQKEFPDIVILDVRLPDIHGLEVLKRIKSINCNTPVIMITAFQDMETTIEAMKYGAYDYVHKPLQIKELDSRIEIVTRMINIRSTLSNDSVEERTPCKMNAIIGNSRPMQQIFKMIGLTCNKNTTILIQGESGTGKELIAKAIHENGIRRNEPFVCINCGALVETLLESELFGHEKGAFTHAIQLKRGKFELAGKGTIFLDEIGELPLSTQAKLLRFLQEKEFERVGGEKTIKSYARIIAATNKNLAKMVTERTFREDLFFRLKVVTINVPPLRDRKNDIPLLVNFFCNKIAKEIGEEPKYVSKKALDEMMKYNWPGNIRELENVLTRAIVLSSEKIVVVENILSALKEEESYLFRNEDEQTLFEDIIANKEDLEKNSILHVLHRVNGNMGQACEILKMSRPTLRNKIRQYNIQKY